MVSQGPDVPSWIHVQTVAIVSHPGRSTGYIVLPASSEPAHMNC